MTDKNNLQPVNKLLLGETTSTEWLQYNAKSEEPCVEEHQEALEAVDEYFEAYMMAYGLESENLINPSIKYDSEGVLDQ